METKKLYIIIGIVIVILFAFMFYLRTNTDIFPLDSFQLPGILKFSGENWANDSFAKRLTVNITGVADIGLDSFPSFLNVTHDLDMQTDFDDISFYQGVCGQAIGDLLAYEIENYTSSNYGIFHVNSSMSTGTNSVCMYYSNSTTGTASNPGGPWDEAFISVWHLNETSGNHLESTGIGSDGTPTFSGSGSQSFTGIVDGADDFQGGSGTEDFVDFTTNSLYDLQTNHTIEIWFKAGSFVSEQWFIGRDVLGNRDWAFGTRFSGGVGKLQFQPNGQACIRNDGDILSTDTWYYAVMVYNDTDAHYYETFLDGETDSGENTGGSCDVAFSATEQVYIGKRGYVGAQGWFDGIIDEVRISNISRGDAYINQTYQLIRNQATYVIFGDEEDLSVVDDEPQWSEDQTNSTIAGSSSEHSVLWTDETNLNGYIFSFCNGSYDSTVEQDTFYNFSGITNPSTSHTAFWASPSGRNPWGGAEASSSQYNDMSTDNAAYAEVSSDAQNNEPFWRFNFTIAEDTSNINWIYTEFNGYEDARETATCYVYNYTSVDWDSIGIVPNSDGTISSNFSEGIDDLIFNQQLVIYCEGKNFDDTTPPWDSIFTDFVQARVNHNANSTTDCSDASAILTNDSFVSMTGTSNWSNVTKGISTTVGDTIKWKVYTNDSINQWNETEEFSYVTTSIAGPPRWSLNQTSQIVAGEQVDHRLFWEDETALSGYIFSFANGSVDFTNDSFVNLVGNSDWSNVTKRINITPGSLIKWKVYANDSDDTWNETISFNYTTPFDVIVNLSASDYNETKSEHGDNYINAKWYSNPTFTPDDCILELRNYSGVGQFNTVNYTGIVSGTDCTANVTNLNSYDYTYIVYTNFSNIWVSRGNHNFLAQKGSFWIFVNLNPEGRWLMRAPLNSSTVVNGVFKGRRYALPTGNGRDIGVMWRDSTTVPDLGFTPLQDEERHCGAWTQFFWDEIGYGNGTIESLYCYMWMYTERDNITSFSEPVIGFSIDNKYDQNSFYEFKTLDENNPGSINATRFNLAIYWNQSLNYDFLNESDFVGMSFKGTGALVQMLTYKNQKSFCIINNINGTSLSNSTALNLTDFDGDGLTDYEELNVTFTDPYDTDTDNDGHDDYQEYINGKNGWDPYDWGTLNIITMNETGNRAFKKELNFSETYPEAESFYSELERELDEGEYNNLTEHDSKCEITADCTNSTQWVYKTNVSHPWSLTQLNYYYNLSEIVANTSTIITMNLFHGGILVSTNLEDGSGTNKSISIASFNSSTENAIIPAKQGHTNAFYLKQIRENITDYINATDGTLRTRVYTINGQSSTNVEWGWGELWVLTGISSLDIIYPLNATPATINESDYLIVNFTFHEEGEEIVSGVTVNNVTIGGSLATINSATTYDLGVGVWYVNVTIPCAESNGEYKNLSITAGTSFTTLSNTKSDAVFYQSHPSCDSCTYDSGDWTVQCSDTCSIATNSDLTGNDLIFNGSGKVYLNANITNIGKLYGTNNQLVCSLIKTSNNWLYG